MLITADSPEFDGVKPYTDKYAQLFIEWCDRVNAFYYGRVKEDFSIVEAKRLAKEANADILILDNMS